MVSMAGRNVTALQEFQLERLRYALHQRPMVTSPLAIRLIDTAIASLYLSCIDAGVGEQARSMIDAYRRRSATRA